MAAKVTDASESSGDSTVGPAEWIHSAVDLVNKHDVQVCSMNARSLILNRSDERSNLGSHRGKNHLYLRAGVEDVGEGNYKP